MLTSARPDLDAYNTALSMSTAELVSALRGLLGAKLVAYLGKVKETRAVRQWAEGTRQIGARGNAARGKAEQQVRTTVTRVQEVGTEVARRVEPVVDQVQSQLGEIPEKVIQVIEPVTARVRELTGSAA